MNKYKNIYKHYENCLDKYGDCAKGVDWPDESDLIKRYKIMLYIINYFDKSKTYSLLDFGAGCGNLYNYIDINKLQYLNYSALDISKKFCDVIKNKYPNINVYNLDILDKNEFELLPEFEFIVMNGIFTEKRDLSDDEMWNFFTNIIKKAWIKTKLGIAFNVMTPIVDWKDKNLFYLSYDKLGKFLKENISRNYIFNQSYGLWEYTVYVFRNSY